MRTPPRMAGKRVAGSARFSAYYKVQYFDAGNLCWRDIQWRYPTAEAAAAAYPKGQRCRTMEVTETGRQII